MTATPARAFAVALLVGLTACATAPLAHESAEHNCATLGQWIDPASGDIKAYDALIEAAAASPIVMLGEVHPHVDHHRWQLATIGALHGRRPDMVLGFEAFPRAVQPALDRWVAGELSEDDFLRETAWTKNWGFDPELYLPMFHFARLHRVPMVALNVERDFVSRIRDEGLENIPEAERRGLSEPKAPSDAYLDGLAEIFSQHLDIRGEDDERASLESDDDAQADDSDDTAEGETAEDAVEQPENIRDDPRFQRFVKVQTTWDRAMAQALVEASARSGSPLVVGVLGSGHLERGFGVPYQLQDLGIDDATVFMPVAPAENCDAHEEEVADALFVLPPLSQIAQGPSGPKLGVMIEAREEKVTVLQVMEDSVAAAADIRDGDAILEAAGVALADTSDLIGIVQQQAPGTWLPLSIQRDGETMEIVAKFPSAANGHGKP
ncbi:MAG: ChaN family lipoprotein [Alphaproteobacteria bacterium]|nr:ChaN family lipoprotein [Alphaproteobacteria bacterium]